MKNLTINQDNLRLDYANKRRSSIYKNINRILWKSKSRHIA